MEEDMYSKLMNWLLTVMLVIACTALIIMMFLTAADVGMRYLFNSPIVWANEMTEICMGFMVPAAAAYCTYKGAQVSVDLLYIRLPRIPKYMVHFFAEGCVAFCMGILTWKSFDLTEELMLMNTVSPDLNLPMWPIGIFFIFTFGLTTFFSTVEMFRGDVK